MFRDIHIWLWSIVMDLEDMLYPWKTKDPPNWAVERYNLDHGIKDSIEDSFYYEWIMAHDQKINRLQNEMIHAQEQIKELKKIK